MRALYEVDKGDRACCVFEHELAVSHLKIESRQPREKMFSNDVVLNVVGQ